jgi:hypothetical protein
MGTLGRRLLSAEQRANAFAKAFAKASHGSALLQHR